MTDHQPRWGCPYCSRVFSSKDHLKGHFEADKKIIFHLLSQLQQALLPSCRQFQEAGDSLIESNGENGLNINSTKKSHAKEPLKCPNFNCLQTKQTYSKKSHLLRHFKMHVVCNAPCECGQTFDRVDRFEKHLQFDCAIIQDRTKDNPGHEQKYLQVLGQKEVLILSAKQNLDKQLEGSQKHGLSDDLMESSTTYENSVKPPDGKRRRTRETEGIPTSLLTTTDAHLSTKITKCSSSIQEESMMENNISPKTPFEPGSLDNVDTISSCIGATTGAQTGPYVAINQLINTPTDGSAANGTIYGEDQSQYPTGLEWTDFNACGRVTSQDLWDNLASVQNVEQYHWDRANTHGDLENWSCVPDDWSSFHTRLDSFNNALASNI